jgi:broad specificity phosphatase PhoE
MGELVFQTLLAVFRLTSALGRIQAGLGPVSRGHFSSVLGAHWIGLPVIGGQRFMFDTGTIGVLENDPRHPENRVISLWNADPSAL